MRRFFGLLLAGAVMSVALAPSASLAQGATKNSKPAKKYDKAACSAAVQQKVTMRGPSAQATKKAALQRCLAGGPGAI
jgi:hypothetical protein